MLLKTCRALQDMKRWQIPKFGNWDYSDEMPITQCFESARKAGCKEDLFGVPVAMPVKLAYQDGRKARKRNDGEGEDNMKQCEQRKPPRRLVIATNAVDEDLYKIPPELLYQKPKRKRFVRNFFSGCLGLNCIA